jgi:rod shape determining protein RodA
MTRRFLRNVDWVLVGAVFFLLGLGLFLVYSASQVPAFPGRSLLFSRQLIWMGLGLGVMLFCTVVPYRVWEEYCHVLYVVSILLLLLVPVLGAERLGAKRWIALGGFQFQPSEVAKFATLLLVSRMLARPRIDVRRLSVLLPVLGVAILPFGLILIEPDLGTSLSIPASLVPMLYWIGLPLEVILLVLAPLASMILAVKLWIWILFLLILGGSLVFFRLPRPVVIVVLLINLAAGAATPIIWNGLKPYQRQRVLTFLNPEEDVAGAGYQVIQSRIAVGSGGILGRGYLKGTQKGLAFLPQQHTDFVFSVLGEEGGFVGCVAALVGFAVLVARGLRLAVRARSRFASVLVVSICSTIMFHVAVNVSMTLGLAPVTGIPLPFLSYGGTFLLATMAQMGLLFNVSLRRNEV